MIPLSSSFDLIKNSINLSLGNKIKNKDLKINFSNYTLLIDIFRKKGKLIKINGIDRIKKKSWLKKIKIFKKIGDNLSTTTNHSNRLGTFFIEAKTKRLLEKRINEVYRKVSFKIV